MTRVTRSGNRGRPLQQPAAGTFSQRRQGSGPRHQAGDHIRGGNPRVQFDQPRGGAGHESAGVGSTVRKVGHPPTVTHWDPSARSDEIDGSAPTRGALTVPSGTQSVRTNGSYAKDIRSLEASRVNRMLVEVLVRVPCRTDHHDPRALELAPHGIRLEGSQRIGVKRNRQTEIDHATTRGQRLSKRHEQFVGPTARRAVCGGINGGGDPNGDNLYARKHPRQPRCITANDRNNAIAMAEWGAPVAADLRTHLLTNVRCEQSEGAQ